MHYQCLGDDSIRYFDLQKQSGEGVDDAGRYLLVNGQKIRVSETMYRTDPLAYERLKAKFGLPADRLSYYEWLESKNRYEAGTYRIGEGTAGTITDPNRTAAISAPAQISAPVAVPKTNYVPLAVAGVLTVMALR